MILNNKNRTKLSIDLLQCFTSMIGRSTILRIAGNLRSVPARLGVGVGGWGGGAGARRAGRARARSVGPPPPCSCWPARSRCWRSRCSRCRPPAWPPRRRPPPPPRPSRPRIPNPSSRRSRPSSWRECSTRKTM